MCLSLLEYQRKCFQITDYFIINYPLIHPSIHSALFFQFAVATGKQSSQDTLLPNHIIWLIWLFLGNPVVFQDQMGYEIPLVCSGPGPGSLQSWIGPEYCTSPGRQQQGIRCPNKVSLSDKRTCLPAANCPSACLRFRPDEARRTTLSEKS